MEKYLRKCLDSLIVSNENMQLLEVLVVNDGSKDSSSQIAHEYESKYPDTFHVIDKENGNYGSCINRGLTESTGKYLKVLDSDDYYDSTVLDRYINFLCNCEADVVFSDYSIVDDEGECLSEFTFDLPTEKTFSLQEVPSEMVIHLAHFTVTYKAEIFRSLNYKQTEGISYTDDEWVFKPMMEVEHAVYFPHKLYFYFRGREGQTFDKTVLKKSLEQRIIVAREMVSYYENNISRCKKDSLTFVTEKLTRKVAALYSLHLILFASKENNKRISEVDSILKQVSKDTYDRLNNVTNKYGWRYIRQWRLCGCSYYTPLVVAYRIARRLRDMMNNKDVLVDYLPSQLKRRTL